MWTPFIASRAEGRNKASQKLSGGVGKRGEMVTGDMNTHHVSMATAFIFVAACRPATGRPARARDLHVRKVKFYLHISP